MNILKNGFSAEQLNSIIERINADTAILGSRQPALALFDGRSGARSDNASTSIEDLADGDLESVFAVNGTHWFRITATSEAELACSLASSVQVDVMDEIGRGWPELSTTTSTVLLSPLVTSEGQCAWAESNGEHFALGSLSSASDRIT
jgi:hypothetical protein